MNCKPGDLAVICKPTERASCTENLLGRFCTVLAAQPRIARLPDGRLAVGGPDLWVIELQHEAEFVSLDGELCATSKFTVIPDHKLRPIRSGDDAETELHLYAPKGVHMTPVAQDLQQLADDIRARRQLQHRAMAIYPVTLPAHPPMAVPTMDEYTDALASMDWHFQRSDDPSTWRAGSDAWHRLVAMKRLVDRDGVVWRERAPEGFAS